VTASAAVEKATLQQRRAARPHSSVWVAASAGSGKTKVLTDRALSLLLHGTAPARILCLTFTKAAAAEMANRLSLRLAAWAVAEESALRKDLTELLETKPDEDLLRRARHLFALVLDTPGGMKIQTVHAFCQSLLGRFPLEARIAPHSKVLDEREAAEMLEVARVEVLSRALEASPESGEGLLANLAEVTVQAQEQSFTELLNDLIRERSRFKRLKDRHQGIEGVVDAVYRVLEADRTTTREALLGAACAEGAFDGAALRRVTQALEQGGKRDRDMAILLAHWLGTPAQREELFDDYLGAFFTKAGPRRKDLIYKAALEIAPDGAEVLGAEAERLEAVRTRLNARTVAQATAALIRIASDILDIFEARKRAQALLDYDDLVLLARELLSREGGAGWVLYKLDGGLDHVLIDEAQDTNPEQWEVIRLLTAEFFAGEGRSETPRTVFAVGDAKQSIYSFQRADPEEFARMQHHFAQRADQAGQYWDRVDLDVSFRSTAAVLDAVDAVFRWPAAADGVVAPEEGLVHSAAREGAGGQVTLWPLVPVQQAAAAAAWDLGDAAEETPPPLVRLAGFLAEKIHRWTNPARRGRDRDDEGFLQARGRPMRPGDILVLVRRRNVFVEELVRQLKQRDVPVAGVDRMVVTDQLAVMDLIALGRVLLLPEDDLTLATVLKGPLVGLDEEQLFDLAYGRDESLWDVLRRRAPKNSAFSEAHAYLADLRAQADFLRPYDLYAAILGPRGGRKKLLQRLGSEASDPIDEFLAAALQYERVHGASLEGFLHWIERGRQEVKRDMEHGVDAVRVMTVHGAKGLQAPVVILPDTLQMPQAPKGLFWPKDETLPPVWPLRKALDGPFVSRLRAQLLQDQQREYRRLLYVAMTRAEDRLYVCGWGTQRTTNEGTWFALVQNALEAMPGAETFDFAASDASADPPWEGTGLRISNPQTADVELRDEKPPATAVAAPLPDWAGQQPAAEPRPPRPLAPSRPRDSEPPVRSPLGRVGGDPFRRGLLIHRLLQSLPDIAPERRGEAAQRFLSAGVHALPAAQRDEILTTTLEVLKTPDFAFLFGPGSRAEVPLVGVVLGREGPEVISGQIDRLFVDSETVWVVDYKSQRPAPASEEDVPPLYLRQLAAYREILRSIYAERSLRSLLLWTDGPFLMPVSNETLDRYAP